MGVLLKKWIKYVVFLSLFFTKVIAQDSQCECNFKNLKDLYLVGQFSNVVSSINCCLNIPKRFTLNEMNRMKELLALTAIAQDSIDEANKFLNEAHLYINNSNHKRK